MTSFLPTNLRLLTATPTRAKAISRANTASAETMATVKELVAPSAPSAWASCAEEKVVIGLQLTARTELSRAPLQPQATAAQLAHSSHWTHFAAMPPPKLAELVKQRGQSSSTTARKAFVDAAAATAAKEQGNKLLAQNDLLAAYAQQL